MLIRFVIKILLGQWIHTCFEELDAFLGVTVNGPMFFVSCRLYPSFPQPPRKCLGPTCHLSTLNVHCIAGAGLPKHMMGGVSWYPKENDRGPLGNQSSLAKILHGGLRLSCIFFTCKFLCFLVRNKKLYYWKWLESITNKILLPLDLCSRSVTFWYLRIRIQGSVPYGTSD